MKKSSLACVMMKKPTAAIRCSRWQSCCHCWPWSTRARRMRRCCGQCRPHRTTSAPCGWCLQSATRLSSRAFATTTKKLVVAAVVRPLSCASRCGDSLNCDCWRSSGCPGTRKACGGCCRACCRVCYRGCYCGRRCCCGGGGCCCCDDCGDCCCCLPQTARLGLNAGSLACWC